MSWLSNFISGSPSSPSTKKQEAEAQRQYQAQLAYYQQLLQQQNDQAAAFRAQDQQRYDAQIAAQQAEAERQAAASRAQLDQQQAQYQQLYAAQQAERDAQSAQAAKKAEDARAYATGRQNLIDTNRSAIDSAYAGFNDDYFNHFAQALVDQYKPQIEQNYDDQRKQTRAAYADTGNLNSSAAARTFGDLGRQKSETEGSLASDAYTKAQGFKNDILGQKNNALSALFAAGNVGDANLPDGTDVSSSLGSLGSQLAALTSAQTTAAGNISPTAYMSGLAPKLPGVTLPNGTSSAARIGGIA